MSTRSTCLHYRLEKSVYKRKEGKAYRDNNLGIIFGCVDHPLPESNNASNIKFEF